MKIDREEARRIADLARLEFDDAALERMAAEMTKILTYIDQLSAVDVEGFSDEPSSAPTPFRDDEPRPGIPQELVERNAPAFADGFFLVPKVIGGE